jgi:hypothetical protein
MIDIKRHIAYSQSPELFMKERWMTFDAFKTKAIKNITPFDYQLQFIKNIHNINNDIVVKSRQMHTSSMMALYIAWYVIFNQDKSVFILSNSSEGSKRILDQIRIILQNYSVNNMFHWQDDFLTNNKTELRLKNGCRIKAAAPTIDAGKGWAPDFCYIDEAAFIKDFEQIYAGFGMSMTARKNTKFIITSTPKDNSFFNKLFLGAGENGYFNPIRLHWSIHPVYSIGIAEDDDKESPFQYTSPWFEDLFYNIYRFSISQTEQELDCVVRYQDETNKVKTISLRIDGDFYRKIQNRLNPGESTSDYIRGLIEKDLRYYM